MGFSCTFKDLKKNGYLDLKKFRPFCSLVAEVTKLFKAHPTTMELYVKMLLFWHKLDNYLFVYRECSYRNKHRKSGSVFLLDYLPVKFIAALIETTSKFVKMSPHTSHPKRRTHLLEWNQTQLYLDALFWFCCRKFQGHISLLKVSIYHTSVLITGL